MMGCPSKPGEAISTTGSVKDDRDQGCYKLDRGMKKTRIGLFSQTSRTRVPGSAPAPFASRHPLPNDR